MAFGGAKTHNEVAEPLRSSRARVEALTHVDSVCTLPNRIKETEAILTALGVSTVKICPYDNWEGADVITGRSLKEVGWREKLSAMLIGRLKTVITSSAKDENPPIRQEQRFRMVKAGRTHRRERRKGLRRRGPQFRR